MKIGTSAFLFPMFGRPVDISVPGYGPLVRPGPTAVHGKPNIWISEKADCFIITLFIPCKSAMPFYITRIVPGYTKFWRSDGQYFISAIFNIR